VSARLGSSGPGPSYPAPARLVQYLAVGLGSALGGILRWLLSSPLPVAGQLMASGFPWATLGVNASGSLLIGFYAARWRGTRGQLFFMTGFCGGYTTFSVFSLETVLLVQAGRAGLAATYVLASVILWLAAAWTGYAIGRRGRRGRRGA